MPTPGFDDPRLASLPPAGNLYFELDRAVGAKIPGSEQFADPRGPGHAQARDSAVAPLMFGTGTATTASGDAIANASTNPTGRGHVSEILNFHGSPAPWILLGILLAAGLLHLSAQGRFKGEL